MRANLISVNITLLWWNWYTRSTKDAVPSRHRGSTPLKSINRELHSIGRMHLPLLVSGCRFESYILYCYYVGPLLLIGKEYMAF